MTQNAKSVYGLVGYPLSHSLSPVMHNAAFKALEVDAVYELFPLEEKNLPFFFDYLKEEDCPVFGLNVTVPYKEKVIPFLDLLAPYAQKIGAVNTITISKDRKLTGHNTDGPGFLIHLAELNVSITGQKIVVIGAGGAARAVISALSLEKQRPSSIRVFDTDISKADALVRDLSGKINVDILQIAESAESLDIDKTDILVNATPVGMKSTDPLPVDAALLHDGQFVYDLIYNPKETRLIKEAKERGARTSNGLGMLYYQGVLALQHWAEEEIHPAVKNIMREKLEAACYGKKRVEGRR